MTPLAEASDPLRFGGKAAGLAQLLRWGFDVPDGVALDASSQESPSEVSVLAPWAVRSSAVGEDGAATSFAGLHLTRLGVRPGELAEAIVAVRASGASAGARAYRAALGLGAAWRMGVVVQSLVAAERSYVAFGRDPVSGADVVVIKGVAGAGEPLVAGEVNPDRYRVSAAGGIVGRDAGDAPCGASDEEIARVAALVRDISRRAGRPQDVELAVAAGRIWVLQARPISTR